MGRGVGHISHRSLCPLMWPGMDWADALRTYQTAKTAQAAAAGAPPPAALDSEGETDEDEENDSQTGFYRSREKVFGHYMHVLCIARRTSFRSMAIQVMQLAQCKLLKLSSPRVYSAVVRTSKSARWATRAGRTQEPTRLPSTGRISTGYILNTQVSTQTKR